jgi:hypothetical protein
VLLADRVLLRRGASHWHTCIMLSRSKGNDIGGHVVCVGRRGARNWVTTVSSWPSIGIT